VVVRHFGRFLGMERVRELQKDISEKRTNKLKIFAFYHTVNGGLEPREKLNHFVKEKQSLYNPQNV